ncbi:MAG: (d)CMP kinase [Clostridia bacterium]
MKRINIAIDGPAGSGKSTVAREIARELNILHLDTGALYRALAFKAISVGIDPGSAVQIIPMLSKTELVVAFNNGNQENYLDSLEVSEFLRSREVSKGASDIAVIPEVREFLLEKQREIARERDVVLDGRDIGSFVLKDAEYKFFLTASVSERAKRRLSELKTNSVTLETIEKEIADRDFTDSHRKTAPLTRADDAILIDTTDMTIDEVVFAVLKLVRGKFKK